jgi:LacI family gluconate utilization system Gnt-I transcriptional repressor
MDHAAIGAAQTRHVLAQGYRHPAFIGCVRVHDYRAHKRLAGYRAAVKKAGLEPVWLTEPTGGHPDLGERLAVQVLDRHPEIDALICNSDIIAMGALRGLRGRVPGEIGVIGFGDNEAGACLTPSLTSIRPPRAEIGRRAAAVIAARIAGEPASHHLFEAELALRQSTVRSPRGEPA